MDAESFRDFVLGVLKQAFPDELFEASDHVDAICWKDTEIGLQNLHADAAVVRAQPDVVRQTIVEHFSRIVKLTDSELLNLPQAWKDARDRVRLQLMPASFAQAGVSVTFPFLEDVLIGIVVDAENGYAFVRAEDIERWAIGLVDLYETARENLQQASQDLGVSFYPGPPAIVALDTNDGYAAARLLLPSLRQFVSQRIGSPFYAGIPNRDFLIMWANSDDVEFRVRVERQLLDDSQSRSHPLTSRILKVTEESIC